MKVHMSKTDLSFTGDTELERELFRQFFSDYSSMSPIWNGCVEKPEAIGFFIRRDDHPGNILKDQMDSIEVVAEKILDKDAFNAMQKTFNQIKHVTRKS